MALVDLLVAYVFIGAVCAAIGGLIAPRKGVEPRVAMVSCFVTTGLGVLYLISQPDVD